MLVQEECVEVHASKQRGWSISAIARHLGRDRKTVQAYLISPTPCVGRCTNFGGPMVAVMWDLRDSQWVRESGKSG